MAGTPAEIADEVLALYEASVADAINLVFPSSASRLTAVCRAHCGGAATRRVDGEGICEQNAA